ncbi:KxYKxGKxW signal peptide domain-containing protein [Weissella confusa]|uniref:KxYKxGKxW signal peptide domain-containing protein n=1 Tax=Weissella confusa TaxID=1583 RepID=UPI0018F1803C|nr:KxYKxGKxW signal peptide domain-containing protein [Weissella confusa]MBJ7692346.1 KxYKxGKxW signal peptide domain-containing protein [Weissella confusa]
MSREDYQQKLADEARVQPQTHKKMYKSKKRWVIAGMTALAVGGATAMAPEDVTTLMSEVYQTAGEAIGGGVAYAASAATAAVNTTTAVTVTNSGVASVASTANQTGTLTTAQANASMRAIGGNAAASGTSWTVLNGTQNGFGNVQYKEAIDTGAGFTISGGFTTNRYQAGNYIGLAFAPDFAEGGKYTNNGNGNLFTNPMVNTTFAGVDLYYNGAEDAQTAFDQTGNTYGQTTALGIRQTNASGSLIADTNSANFAQVISSIAYGSQSDDASWSYSVTWAPTSVTATSATGTMTITALGSNAKTTNTQKTVSKTVTLPKNVVMQMVGNNGGATSPATATGSIASIQRTVATTPVNVTYVDGFGSALISATSFTAQNWTAVGITCTPTPIATNATASFAAPSISGYSAVAVSYAANTNTSALVTSTTNLLVTSDTSNNNIQIQYKDIEAPKMSLTNTVTYQQNETINSSDMVNRLVTSLGDNSPKAVTTSLTSGSINTASAGTYQVQITATDAAGNATSSMATVTVLPKSVSAASSVASSASSDASSASSMISSATSAAKSSSASVEASSASQTASSASSLASKYSSNSSVASVASSIGSIAAIASSANVVASTNTAIAKSAASAASNMYTQTSSVESAAAITSASASSYLATASSMAAAGQVSSAADAIASFSLASASYSQQVSYAQSYASAAKSLMVVTSSAIAAVSAAQLQTLSAQSATTSLYNTIAERSVTIQLLYTDSQGITKSSSAVTLTGVNGTSYSYSVASVSGYIVDRTAVNGTFQSQNFAPNVVYSPALSVADPGTSLATALSSIAQLQSSLSAAVSYAKSGESVVASYSKVVSSLATQSAYSSDQSMIRQVQTPRMQVFGLLGQLRDL